ncbi:hypothetical protein [Zobellella sp. DQSA1]|uniref:hypothetical protein n=1 Tax=Zobellella sp. DQSA1 TaxID=3342386 RepID=UPI0035C0266D
MLTGYTFDASEWHDHWRAGLEDLEFAVVDIGPAGDELAPNNFTYVEFGGYFKTFDQDRVWISTGRSVLVEEGETYSQAGMRLYDEIKNLSYARIEAGSTWTTAICVGIYVKSYFLGSIIAPTGCIGAPPPLESCALQPLPIMLDHGEIMRHEVNGSRATAAATINCSSITSVVFRLASGMDTVALSPSGQARLLIDGVPLGVSMTLGAGVTLLTVSDILEGVTGGGMYEGSAVLIVEPA